MASKRNLYKPAPQEKVGNREKRRPLAQGRLVTKSDGVEAKPFNYDGSYLANISVDASHITDGDRSGGRFPESSPRKRETPNYSVIASPKPERPSRVLELSDTDSEVSFQLSSVRMNDDRLDGQKGAGDVVVLDASRATKDPNQSEVDIRVGYENSPVKIICHSPSVVKSNLRNTGDTALARKVQVDQVPSVSIMSGDGRGRDGASHARLRLGKSPLVVRERAIAGKTAQQSSAARLVHVDSTRGQHTPIRSSNTPIKQPEYAQPKLMEAIDRVNLEMSDGSTAGNHSSDSADTIPYDSNQQNQQIVLDTHRPIIMSKNSPKKDKKKKKATRVVTSRYMQSVKASMHQSDTSSLAKSVAKGKNAMKASSKGSEVISKTKKVKKTGSVTPKSLHTMGGGLTSTPTYDQTLLPADGSIDASAIGPPPKSSVYSTPNANPDQSVLSSISNISGQALFKAAQLRHSRNHGNMSCESILSTGSAGSMDSVCNGGGSHKKTLATNQEQLELEFAVYTQWLYMTRMAEKAARQQEKQAMNQLNGLWEENQTLHKKYADLQSDLAKLTNANMLDETLHTQESGLEQIVADLNAVRGQYTTLAHAVDTTRHQVHTKAVHIPANQDQYIDSLLVALRDSEQLLGELNSMTRQSQPQISSFASAMNTLDKAVQSEDQEMSKCEEMLAAVRSLTTQESSLRIQQIQTSG